MRQHTPARRNPVAVAMAVAGLALAVSGAAGCSRQPDPPALNLAHLGLAGTGLLIWIAYLATGLTGLAWTAAALLTLVFGLGMTLVFFLPSQRRHPSVVATGAHIALATTTFLFVLLAAVGAG